MNRFSKINGAILLLCACGFLSASAESELFQVDGKGRLNLGGVEVELLHFDPSWKYSRHGDNSVVESNDVQGQGRRIKGIWTTKSGEFDFEEVIRLKDGALASVSYELTSEAGVPTQQTALSVSLPAAAFKGKTFFVDGRAVKIPTELSKLNFTYPTNAGHLSLPCQGGWLNLSFEPSRLLFQDMRKYGRKVIEVRILLAKAGISQKAEFEMGLTHSDAPEVISPAESAPAKPDDVFMAASEEWIPLTHRIDVEAGSILDFSGGVESPAGQYGPIVVNQSGHFGFAHDPNRNVRLMGANLCFSANFLTNEEADRLAERFRRMGYNSVRFHHYDDMLTRGHGDQTGVQLDPEKLDRLDYLFAAMKKAGMYVTIDLYTFRDFPKGMIPEMNKSVKTEIKALVPILPSAFEAWSGMVENLLNHVNPYTGTAWKDDPAFFSVCPMNEDTINHVSNFSGQKVKDLYEKAFKEYLAERGETEIDGKGRTQQYYAFIQDVKARSNRQLEAFIKGISEHVLVTGSNFIADRHQTFFRSEFDFVDNHQYWDHPSFPMNNWRLPNAYKQQSAIMNYAKLPRHIMPSRIFGSPFTVTEYNYCPPNKYRAEGGTLMGAYSALQDWDGLYRFAWAHSDGKATTVEPINGFDMATDPLSMMTERQVALLFARGDVAPAPSRVIYPVDMDEVLTNWWAFPDEASRLGLSVQIGTWAFDNEAGLPEPYTAATGIRQPEGDLAGTPWMSFSTAAEKFGTDGSTIVSETQEIELDAARIEVKVITERTESLVLRAGNDATGKVLSGSAATTFTNLSASSMDGRPLNKSQRVLLMQLTDVRNTQMHFQNDEFLRLEAWGELPHLIRRGTIDVSLQSTAEGMTLYAVDLSGKRLEVISTEYVNGAYRFTLDTAPDHKESRMAYELVKE